MSGIAIIGVCIGKIGEQVANAQVKAIKAMDNKLERNTMTLVQGPTLLSRSLEAEGDYESPSVGGCLNLMQQQGGGLFKTVFLPYMPLLVPFLIGAYFEGRDQNWTFVDILYYATCTITTIGYGDLSPDSGTPRIIAIFFVPMSAFALASMLSKYAALVGERRIIRAQRAILQRGLRMSDLDAMDKDGDGEVSKIEFFEFMLLSMDRVGKGFLD